MEEIVPHEHRAQDGYAIRRTLHRRTMKTSSSTHESFAKARRYCTVGHGGATPEIAVVIAIEQTQGPNEKYGDEVDAVTLDDHYVLTLNNGHWCYSYQVDGLSNSLTLSQLQNKFGKTKTLPYLCSVNNDII